MEGSAAQLAAEKSRYAEYTHTGTHTHTHIRYAEASALAASKDNMLELERRNYASVQVCQKRPRNRPI